MPRRLFTQYLLGPSSIEPSSPEMEVIGTFNPGVVAAGSDAVFLVRVAERPRETERGYVALPRWEPGAGIAIDHVPEGDIAPVDPRVVMLRREGRLRLTFLSHLRVMRSRDGRTIDPACGARFIPETPYETYGVEDARITPLDGRYYFTYVAVSPHGAATALASTADFQSFERHGIIFCPENKDVLLFPEKVGGEYVALHRPNPATPFSAPEMWLARSPDLIHWGGHERLLGRSGRWDAGRVGGGVPPFRTDRGWLEIYHGNDRLPGEPGVGRYYGALLLMDLEDPGRIIAHSEAPFMVPEEAFEREGFVREVVFPTGAIEREGVLLVYYGAADTSLGVAGFDMEELLAALR